MNLIGNVQKQTNKQTKTHHRKKALRGTALIKRLCRSGFEPQSGFY